jgi:membrane-associated HD superfamily phosphohydrolase
MKQLLRIEYLLLIAPLLLPVIAFYSVYYGNIPEETIYRNDPANNGAILAFEFFMPMCQFLFALLPAYLVHHFLRIIRKRNKMLCFAHVILSLIALIYFSSWGNYAASVVPGWHTTVYPPQAVKTFLFIVLFVLLQLTFIIYGLMIIQRWRRTLKPVNL